MKIILMTLILVGSFLLGWMTSGTTTHKNNEISKYSVMAGYCEQLSSKATNPNFSAGECILDMVESDLGPERKN